jgi:CoA:oxalate CoA-transferase
MMKKPLEGVKVLDMTRILSGPMCTMILGDLGAEITKLEPWPNGDDSRGNPPFVKEESMYFVSLNRNKKSIVINMKSEDGKELFQKLVKQSQVLVENFRPGVLSKLGFTYETLKNFNEKLIYCAISGFGHAGPYKNRAAYDAVVQAMGGIMSVTGPEGGGSVRVGTSIGDATAALYGVIGILGALRVVENGGPGQFIDISMLDCQVALVEGQLARYFGTGKVPVPVGTRHATATPFDLFKTKNGSIVVAIQNNNLWQKFCPLLGLERLSDEEKFKTNSSRCDNEKELKAIIQPIMQQKTTAEWAEIFDRAGIAYGPVNNMKDLAEDPHLRFREMIVEVDGHKKIGKVKYPNTPLKYSDAEVGIQCAAPVLGQHTEDILARLGYNAEEIKKMKETGTVK